MLKNTDCTLYKFNNGTYTRVYIPECYWLEYDERSQSRQGQLSTATTTIYLYDLEKIPSTTNKDIFVKGNCPFVFTGTTESAVSAEFKSFRENYEFVTAMKINNLAFGGLPHIEVYCK